MRVLQLGLSIRPTAVGKGVFAMKNYRKGQALGQVQGRVHDEDGDYDEDYVMAFGENSVLEPGAPFRFLNHSCEPNAELVELEPYDGSGPSTMWVYATRTIRADDQITIDYAWPIDAAIPCRCGASKCRGWVVDPAALATLLRRARTRARPKNATAVNRAAPLANRPTTQVKATTKGGRDAAKRKTAASDKPARKQARSSASKARRATA